jgi:hypothetical protein
MQKHMQNQKGISSLVGIVIIVAAAAVAVSGVLAYQYVWNPIEIAGPEKGNEELEGELLESETEIYEREFKKKIIKLADENSFIPGELEEAFSNKIQKDSIVFGDLNNDDIEDVVYVAVSWGGGTGFFRDLVIVLNENGNIGYSSSSYLGDRPEIKSIVIQSGIIVVDIQEWQGLQYTAKYRLSKGELDREEITEINKLVPTDETADWQTYRNEEYGFEFKYPEKLDTEYISIIAPYPNISFSSIDANFACDREFLDKKGLYDAEYGNIANISINENDYCVLEISEGAMGHTYKTYYYITNRQDRQAILRFVLSYPSCGALYGIDNKMQKCEEEKETFNVNLLADQIFSTLEFTVFD